MRRLYDAIAGRGSADLLGRDFDEVNLAQIHQHNLITTILAEIDFDAVDERPASPILVVGLQGQVLLRRVQLCDGKWASADECALIATSDAVPRQRKFGGKVRDRRAGFDHDEIAKRENLPLRIGQTQ